MTMSGEMITGQDLLSALLGLIRSRKICRMEIPDTDLAWFTVLLDLEKRGKELCLAVDWVPGFEEALPPDREPVVAFEFLETGGIPCRFKTMVSASDGRSIRVKVPETIQRVQRREYFRMKAPLGSEVILRGNSNREQKGTIKDYSLGGVAIFLERPFAEDMGESIEDLVLKIPREKERLEVRVRLALLRRTSLDISGRVVCALEFMEMEDAARELLWHHLLEEQRSSLRRVRGL